MLWVGLGVAAGCGEHGGSGRVALDLGRSEAGTADDAGVADAGPDAEAPEAVCEAFCAALEAACGPPDAGGEPCAATCKARLASARPNCVSAFRAFFACLSSGEDGVGWTCVAPGVARYTGCADEAAAYGPCAR